MILFVCVLISCIAVSLWIALSEYGCKHDIPIVIMTFIYFFFVSLFAVMVVMAMVFIIYTVCTSVFHGFPHCTYDSLFITRS